MQKRALGISFVSALWFGGAAGFSFVASFLFFAYFSPMEARFMERFSNAVEKAVSETSSAAESTEKRLRRFAEKLDVNGAEIFLFGALSSSEAVSAAWIFLRDGSGIYAERRNGEILAKKTSVSSVGFLSTETYSLSNVGVKRKFVPSKAATDEIVVVADPKFVLRACESLLPQGSFIAAEDAVSGERIGVLPENESGYVREIYEPGNASRLGDFRFIFFFPKRRLGVAYVILAVIFSLACAAAGFRFGTRIGTPLRDMRSVIEKSV